MVVRMLIAACEGGFGFAPESGPRVGAGGVGGRARRASAREGEEMRVEGGAARAREAPVCAPGALQGDK